MAITIILKDDLMQNRSRITTQTNNKCLNGDTIENTSFHICVSQNCDMIGNWTLMNDSCELWME